MKKVITMIMVGLMVLGSFSVTFAAEPDTVLSGSILEETKDAKADKLELKELKQTQKAAKLNLLKEFAAGLHSINAIRIERNQLQIKLIEKHDKLIDLHIQAKEAGNKEGLEAVKLQREQLKILNNEIAALHESAAAAKTAFREALKSNDGIAAKAALEKVISIHSTINDKIEDKALVLDSIIDILS